MLRVAHITFSLSGGAGFAAKSIVCSQRSIGIDAELLTVGAKSISSSPLHSPLVAATALFEAATGPAAEPRVLFTLFRQKISKFSFDELKDFDIINLHWTPGAVSDPLIAQLSLFGRPIVWTLHDYRPISGGCHFPGHCRGFEITCSSCPQVRKPFQAAVAASLKFKTTNLGTGNLHLVAPSRGLYFDAQRSHLGQKGTVSYIPNPLASREIDELRLNRQTIRGKPLRYLFVADDLADPRKGFKDVLEWWKFKQNHDEALLVVGSNFQKFNKTPGVTFMGRLSRTDLENVYSQSNAMVFGSTQDNAPNVVAEAASFGLPIFCTDVGMKSWLEKENINIYDISELDPLFFASNKTQLDNYKNFLNARLPQTVAMAYYKLYLDASRT